MSDSDQDLQRRELIFKILDKLQDQEERINADKVARLAKMGKQTVLPYYKEWRYLDDLDRQQQEDLPQDLVRILKRGIAQWKHTLAEQTQVFEEKANGEIDELKLTVQNLSERQAENEKERQELSSKLQLVSEQYDESIKVNHEKDQELASLKAQLTAAEDKNEEAQTLFQQTKQDHAEALQETEQRLDSRHQDQLNHWIKVVDNERREKQELEKSKQQHQEQQVRLEKERNELNNRLESKSRAFIEACEERNQLKQHHKELQENYKPIEQCCLLLDCEPENILPSLRALIKQAQNHESLEEQVSLQKQTVTKLETDLQQFSEQATQLSELEKQLERCRGYTEALEKNLSVQIPKVDDK